MRKLVCGFVFGAVLGAGCGGSSNSDNAADSTRTDPPSSSTSRPTSTTQVTTTTTTRPTIGAECAEALESAQNATEASEQLQEREADINQQVRDAFLTTDPEQLLANLEAIQADMTELSTVGQRDVVPAFNAATALVTRCAEGGDPNACVAAALLAYAKVPPAVSARLQAWGQVAASISGTPRTEQALTAYEAANRLAAAAVGDFRGKAIDCLATTG